MQYVYRLKKARSSVAVFTQINLYNDNATTDRDEDSNHDNEGGTVPICADTNSKRGGETETKYGRWRANTLLLQSAKANEKA